jgi:hypothetical protein
MRRDVMLKFEVDENIRENIDEDILKGIINLSDNKLID